MEKSKERERKRESIFLDRARHFYIRRAFPLARISRQGSICEVGSTLETSCRRATGRNGRPPRIADSSVPFDIYALPDNEIRPLDREDLRKERERERGGKAKAFHTSGEKYVPPLYDEYRRVATHFSRNPSFHRRPLICKGKS